MPEDFEMDDLVVLLLGAPGGSEAGSIKGITRLEKLAFLADKETPANTWLTESTGFRSDKFGPFSKKIYEAVDALYGYGLITDTERIDSSPEEGWESANIVYDDSDVDPFRTRDFKLTEMGWEYYRSLLGLLKPDADPEAVIGPLKTQFADMPLRQLVRYVYQRHPDYTDKSIIRDEILAR